MNGCLFTTQLSHDLYNPDLASAFWREQDPDRLEITKALFISTSIQDKTRQEYLFAVLSQFSILQEHETGNNVTKYKLKLKDDVNLVYILLDEQGVCVCVGGGPT